MQNKRWIWRCISLLGLVALFAAGCGTSSKDETVNTLSPGDPAPSVKLAAPHGLDPDRPVAQAITGVPMTSAGTPSDGAPLGLNPDYHVTEVLPVSFSGSGTSRATSALAPGQSYAIYKATVTAASITNPAGVDFNSPLAARTFDEGKLVNVWIQYETVANTTFHWTWASALTKFNVSVDHTEATAGVHTAYMPMLIPLDPATNPTLTGTFTCTFGDKTGSVVVVPPDQNQASVDYLVKDVPGTPDPYPNIAGGAYMLWEDLLTASDYDYNDYVAGFTSVEYVRQTDGLTIQISFTVKAIARGAGYDSDWQFNMDSVFSGNCTAFVQQYKANGTPKGAMRVWHSVDGTSIPVFVSNKTDAIPAPPDSFATNTVPNSTWVDGDYAAVTILFDTPQDHDQSHTPHYTPAPFKPSIRVQASATNVYVINLWTKRGDPVDSAKKRPLGFIVPGNFAWPCEGRTIDTGYTRFNAWVDWVNNPALPASAEPKWWLDTPVYTSNGVNNVYRPAIFKGNPPNLPIVFPSPAL